MLYQKFLQNRCTEEELHLLFRYFETSGPSELHHLIRQELEGITKSGEASAEKDIVSSGVSGEINPGFHPYKTKTLRSKFGRLSVAAAVLVFFSVGIAWLYRQPGKKETIKVAAGQPNRDVPPGGNKAILTLANGTKLSLTEASDGKLAQEGGVTITKTADGQLEYAVSNDALPSVNTIETPRGGQYKVRLPDGTQIWLNAASSLRFPTVFAGNERTVQLTGEAYFEVARNRDRPFRVLGNGQVVEVLGTCFNINAYQEEGPVKTTLLEGSVRVRHGGTAIILKPGEQASTGQTIEVKGVDLQECVAWKNGRMQFSNASIQSIMRMLARWYDIDVVYAGKPTDAGFGGSVSRSKNISEILKILELTGDVHFEVEGRKVIVKL